MFSGIVETTGSVCAAQAGDDVLRIAIERPKAFTDLHAGDSICTDGACLTLEKFDLNFMHFALGPETLKITGWTADSVLKRVVNLERSLRLQDRLHGHLVNGHVDTAGVITELARLGDTLNLTVDFPKSFAPFIWPKGSVALNGVSLTINQATDHSLTVGLIPETLRRTNLGTLKSGGKVNIEIDNMARGLVNWARLQQESK